MNNYFICKIDEEEYSKNIELLNNATFGDLIEKGLTSLGSLIYDIEKIHVEYKQNSETIKKIIGEDIKYDMIIHEYFLNLENLSENKEDIKFFFKPMNKEDKDLTYVNSYVSYIRVRDDEKYARQLQQDFEREDYFYNRVNRVPRSLTGLFSTSRRYATRGRQLNSVSHSSLPHTTGLSAASQHISQPPGQSSASFNLLSHILNPSLSSNPNEVINLLHSLINQPIPQQPPIPHPPPIPQSSIPHPPMPPSSIPPVLPEEEPLLEDNMDEIDDDDDDDNDDVVEVRLDINDDNGNRSTITHRYPSSHPLLSNLQRQSSLPPPPVQHSGGISSIFNLGNIGTGQNPLILPPPMPRHRRSMAMGLINQLLNPQQLQEDVKVVVKQEDFDNFEKNKYKDIKDNEGVPKECAISLMEFEDDDDVIKLPCNHYFELGGAKHWLLTCSNKCPVCRKEAAPGNPLL